MSESFSDMGRRESIGRLFEGTGFKPFQLPEVITQGKGWTKNYSRLWLEGIDFNLVYFPLGHLGYKVVAACTAELYAGMYTPESLSLSIGVDARHDFPQIRELFEGVVTAAKEHGYKSISLDLMPSQTGLSISTSVCGFKPERIGKRRPVGMSKDIICLGGNIGAAFFGQHILQQKARAFEGKDQAQDLPKLEDYKMFLAPYLKPDVPANIVSELVKDSIYPAFGYSVSKGLAETCYRLAEDSSLGVKIYASMIPFEGRTFDLGKRFNIDPISAAFNGGEDYALMYVIASRDFELFKKNFAFFEPIGHLAQPEAGCCIVTPDGAELPIRSL